MPDENTPYTSEEEKLVQQFANMTIDAWSRTLVACTRKIKALESRLLAVEGDIVVLKRLVANRRAANGRGGFDA